MYLIKSFTLEDSNHTITFDLFDKDGEPILIESALESDGTRGVYAYDGYLDVSERLFILDLMCDGTAEADRAIHVLQMFVKEFYGSK